MQVSADTDGPARRFLSRRCTKSWMLNVINRQRWPVDLLTTHGCIYRCPSRQAL